jgi:hypothetical protein
VRTLTWETAERIARTCERFTAVTDASCVNTIATHDFDLHGPLELRILPDFGFGGKLYLNPRDTDRPIWCSAYPEDSAAVWFPTEQFEALQAALTQIPTRFTAAVECVASRRHPAPNPSAVIEYDWHVVIGDHEPGDDFIPIGCGQGINLPGRTEIRVPTCKTCRLATEVGTAVAYAVCELIDTLEVAVRKAANAKTVASILCNAHACLTYLVNEGPILAAERFHHQIDEFDPDTVAYPTLFARIAATHIADLDGCLTKFKTVPERGELTAGIAAFTAA